MGVWQDVAMSKCKCLATDNEYPDLVARTGRFRMGAPRSFVVRAGVHTVGFTRSENGYSSSLDLWLVEGLNGTPDERCLVRAADLLADDEHLSPAERARRERLRESGSGITTFTTDDSFSLVAFSLSGQLWVVDVASGARRNFAQYQAVVDPRVSPNGDYVAFTSGADFVVARTIDGSEAARLASESDTVTYGLADFIASEELDRFRGHWWSPDSTQVLVERNDEAPVQIKWISDPTYPDQEARPHRYPSAGTTNSTVSLVQLQIATGAKTSVSLDGFEYLVNVEWSVDAPLVTLMKRDQTLQVHFHIREGRLVEIARTEDGAWVDCGLGTPTHVGNLLLTHDDRSGRRTLALADTEVWDGQRFISQIVSADEHRMVLAVFNEPWQREIIWVDKAGTVTSLSDSEGYALAVADGEYVVVVQHDLVNLTPQYFIQRRDSIFHEVTSHQVTSPITPKVKIKSRTNRELPTAVLWPENHKKGSHKLPVIVSIYGGPHHAEVMASQSAFTDDQWLANQGYCVVVIDNAGTPGKSPVWEREVVNDLSDVVLRDQVAALKALGDKYDDMDLSRVGIHGWSFGGYLSALAVLDRPDVFHCGWAGAPVTDWRMYDTAYTERYLGHPDTNGEVYDAGSLIRRASQLKRPLALIHGLADDNVLAAHSLQLSGALLAAGKAHTFLPLAGVSHMTPQVEITRNIMLLMRDFFDANLGVKR